MKYPKKNFKRETSGYLPYEFKDGELIEEKVKRLTQEKTPVDDSAPIIYTERKDGVLPAYDIRTILASRVYSSETSSTLKYFIIKSSSGYLIILSIYRLAELE